jgi:hypothetical protein
MIVVSSRHFLGFACRGSSHGRAAAHEAPTIDGQAALLPAFGVSMFSIMWSNIPNLIRPLLPGSALTLQIDLVQNGGVVSTAWFAGNASAWIVGKNGEHLLFGN